MIVVLLPYTTTTYDEFYLWLSHHSKNRPKPNCLQHFQQPPEDNSMKVTVSDSAPKALLTEFSCGAAWRKASPQCYAAA